MMLNFPNNISQILLLSLFLRRGSGEQNHKVRVFNSADPDLLAINHIIITVTLSGGFEAGGVGACSGFGDTKTLQPEFSRGDFGEIVLFLGFIAVP